MLSSRKSVLVLAKITPLSSLESVEPAALTGAEVITGSAVAQVSAVIAESDHATAFLRVPLNLSEKTLIVDQSFLCLNSCGRS